MSRSSRARISGDQALCVGLGWGWYSDSPGTVSSTMLRQSCKNHMQCECVTFLGKKCQGLSSSKLQSSFDSSHQIIQVSSVLLASALCKGFLSSLLDWNALLSPAEENVQVLFLLFLLPNILLPEIMCFMYLPFPLSFLYFLVAVVKDPYLFI